MKTSVEHDDGKGEDVAGIWGGREKEKERERRRRREKEGERESIG